MSDESATMPGRAPAPQAASPEPAPQHWLFAASTLGASFRVYLPTVLIMRALGLIRMLIFAYLIIKAEYGLQRLALLLINFLSAIARLGLPVGIERYIPQHEQAGQLARFVRRGVLLGGGVTAAIVLILAVLSPWLAPVAFATEDAATSAGHAYLLQITLACLAVTFVLSFYLSLQGVLRGLRMYRALSAVEILHGLSFLAIGIVALIAAGNLRLSDGQLVKLAGAALVIVLAYGASLLFATAVVGLALARHLARWRSQHQPMNIGFAGLARRLLRFSTYITGANVLWTLFMLLAVWRVNKLANPAEAGLFALARDMMQVVQLLAMAVWPTVQNSAAHLWERSQRSQAIGQLGQVFRLSGWPLWLLSAALVLARNPIESLLPPDYAGAAEVIPWLLIMFLYLIGLSLPTAHAYLLEKTRLLLFAAVVGIAAHAASVDWLIRSSGVVGAAQSGVLGAVAAVVTLSLTVALAYSSRTGKRDSSNPSPSGRGWPEGPGEGFGPPGPPPDRRIGPPRWLTARDMPLLIAPVVLALPSLWPAKGAAILVAAAAGVIVLLPATNLLWTARDRAMFVGYLSASWRAMLRQIGNSRGKE